MREGHLEHLPRDIGGYMPTWQLYVIHRELAVPTVIGAWERTRVAPGTADPYTGLITFHPSVIILIGVAL